MFHIDRAQSLVGWGRTGPPLLRGGVKESVFLPLGPLKDEDQRDQYMNEFNILYEEHIEGFKKIKKEKGEKERNMEWRQRLKRKKEENSGGGSSSSGSSSSSSSSGKNNTGSSNKGARDRRKNNKQDEERDRLKAIQAYKDLKAGRHGKGNQHKRLKMSVRGGGANSKPSMTMQNSSAMHEFESGSSSNNGGSNGGRNRNSSSTNSSITKEGGGKKRLSKAERKKLKAQGKG